MKQAEIFYIVRGLLYRDNIHNPEKEDWDKCIDIHKEFRSESIEEARQQAHSYFNSVLEVLCESKNVIYENDEQAQEDLKDFYYSGIKKDFEDRDFGMNLGLLFCRTNDKPYICKNGMVFYNDKLIRVFGYQPQNFRKQIDKNVKEEMKYLMLEKLII